MPPLLYHGRLPAGALVSADLVAAPEPPRQRPSPRGASNPPAPIWFSTSDATDLIFNQNQRVTGWSARPPATAQARLVGFNEAGTGWDSANPALEFTAKTHGGLFISDALPSTACFSIGLLYLPAAKTDAQTLLSLQARDDDDYLFLSAENDEIRFAMKRSDQTLSAPDPQKLTLLVLSSDGASVRLSLNRNTAISTACALPPLPRDPFIGCRGGAPSLLWQLCRFKVTRVVILPDTDVLAGEVARAPEAALDLWQERLRHGFQG